MGRIAGKPHSKKRKYLSESEQQSVLAEYASGAMQTALAAKYEVSQGAISKTLRRFGVAMRTQTESQRPTFDVDVAAKLFVEDQLTSYAVADALGVSQSAVGRHLKRMGVFDSKGRGHRYKFFDRDFFDEVNHASAYWAGFIAADGCVHDEKDTVSFGLHPDDRALLENLKKAARLEQPIEERDSCGKPYVWMNVTCPQWVKALKNNFRITSRKSLTIQPPTHLGWEFVWSFVRGVFDGDGHVSIAGDCLQFTSGSQPFLTWVVRDVCRAHHKISETPPYTRQDGSVGVAYACRMSGPVMRDAVRLLYADSTPETRLARKYARFKAAGVL